VGRIDPDENMYAMWISLPYLHRVCVSVMSAPGYVMETREVMFEDLAED